MIFEPAGGLRWDWISSSVQPHKFEFIRDFPRQNVPAGNRPSPRCEPCDVYAFSLPLAPLLNPNLHSKKILGKILKRISLEIQFSQHELEIFSAHTGKRQLMSRWMERRDFFGSIKMSL